MTKLSEEIRPIMLNITQKAKGHYDDEVVAFFGTVALELWALNLTVFDEADGDELLNTFVKDVKARSLEIKKNAKKPKWRQ